MSEIEVKIIDINKDKIIERLESLGAKKVKNELQVNHMYDFPGEAIYKGYKGYCRIREIESLVDGSHKYILGIKKMKSQAIAKEMLEFETEIADLEAGKRILQELGLHNCHTHNKKRESYELNGALYEFDEWQKDVFPLPYLEVEATDLEHLKNAVEIIGYTMDKTTSKNLRELREELENSTK